MQVSRTVVDDREVPQHPEPLLARRPGTIGVTLRLDPPRYNRLKRLVRRLSTTSQSVRPGRCEFALNIFTPLHIL